jgi:quaternary ammonium compound-resistance protein SugE
MPLLVRAQSMNFASKKSMNWIILIIAGLFEVAFASCLGKAKDTTGAEAYWWYGGFVISLAVSMILLLKATQSLPIGTAYAVWTGIGAVGTVLMGIFVFKEPVTFWRIFFIVTLISSIIGLKAVSSH